MQRLKATFSTDLARNAAQARPGPATPLRFCGPRSLTSNRPPNSLRVPSAITTLSGSAIACSRAARFGVSPTTPRSCASPEPRRSPTTTISGRDAHAHVQRRTGGCLQLRRGLDDREPSLNRVLGVVLVRLGVAESRRPRRRGNCADETSALLDQARAAFLIGSDTPAHVFRIEPRRDRGRTHEIAEHYGGLAALGRVVRLWLDLGGWLTRGEFPVGAA